MAETLRPRRSVIYMPASNLRALEKGKSLDVDGIIVDLEDAVAPDAKDLARDQAVQAAKAGGYGHRELILRVNGLSTPWGHADLVAAATSGFPVVLLPKVESADMVRRAAEILEGAGAPDDQMIWVMIETPLGVLNAKEIASAHRRMGGFVMGTSDLAKELRCAHTADREPMLAALSLALLAARAFGLVALDGVHLNLDDLEGFARSCDQGQRLGFDGKTLIHPKQIDAANTAFAPDATAVADARKMIEGFEAAAAEGKGVVVIDGKLVENLHVENAKRLVAMADAIAARTAE